MGKRKEKSKSENGAASVSHPKISHDAESGDNDLNPNENGAKDAAPVQQASTTGNHDKTDNGKPLQCENMSLGDIKNAVSSVQKSKRERKPRVASPNAAVIAAAVDSTMDSAQMQDIEETDPKQQAAKCSPTEPSARNSFSPGSKQFKPTSHHSNSSKALPLSKNSGQKPEPTLGRGSRKPTPSKKRLLELSSSDLEQQGEQKRGKKKHDIVDDTEKEFDTSWICCECKEAECMMKSDADELLICEGVCRRLFHYPCAGLSRPPPKEEEYICPDCTSKRHVCAYCQEYGVDDEDVFACSFKDGCGLFFHESCLEVLNVEVKLVPEKHATNTSTSPTTASASTEGIEQEHRVRREFFCPAHNCWTCTQKDMAAKQASNDIQKEADAPSKKGKGGNKKKGRGGKKTTIPLAFQQKKIPLLIRCLVCPTAYHISCIPPLARFHELALLCHEHAPAHKLPDLDVETSIQGTIETKIGEKYAPSGANAGRRRRQSSNAPSATFFHGLSGDKISNREHQLVERLHRDDDFIGQDDVFFCLPCEIKDAVHSKPPSYHHVHSLQYIPGRRPTRIPLPGDVCECSGECGDDCINRVLYVECVGEKGDKKSNCAVGPNCGNRQLAQRLLAKCQTQREQGRGWGLVTTEAVAKGKLVQEYVGEVVDAKTKEERLAEWVKEHPNDPNFYVMSLSPGWFIDAREKANRSRFINHSCDPNCLLTPVNVNGYIRNGIFARRDIAAGEFLSYDYHFDTRQGDRFVCRCGAKNCRGTMKGGVTAEAEKSKKEQWEQAKKDYEKDKEFLAEFNAKEEARRSLVDAMVPHAENADELVANGAPARHYVEAQQGRIFLWRNAQLGSDFASRLMRRGIKEEAKSNTK